MSTTAQVVEASSRDRAWMVWSIALVGLVVLLYASVLKALIGDWWSDPDYGHGFLVPLFAGYVAWRSRKQWLKSEVKPSNFGLLVMVGAIVLLFGGSLGAGLFTSRFWLVVLVAGIVVFLAGWR